MLDNTIKVGSEDEIVAIFKENTEWIESKGESGQRAILDGYVLSHMNFVGDSMRGASLDRCVFDYSDCNYVDFKGAKLRNASFTKSKLACADFSSVKLNGTTFRGASLNGATLIKTKINWGDFNKAKLHKSNFQMSYIRNTDFTDANLAMTSFENANLISNNFFNANLRYANLVNTNLTRTNLSNVDLSNANITGAVLCQVLTEGWVIKNIKCDYIFADEKKEVRIPKNRLFEEGEFEELYSWFPSFVYYFKDKMHALDPYLISVIVSGLNKSNEDLHLQIDEIKGKGLYPQIEFSNRGEKNASKVEEVVTNILDEKLQEIRELIANIENLFDPAVAAIIDKVMGNTSMTKLEFNAPVQNVITDNKGTVNIQTVSVAELKQIIDSLSNIKPQSKFSEVAKNTATQELSKLMANEVKGLTTETISWLKSVSSDLPAEIARNINSWLG